MKIRTDYVSNSSSSSFVFAKNEIFNYFKVTKKDIFDALVDAYGVENYNDSVKRIKEYANNHKEDWNDEFKYNDFGPIYVYDLEDENDRNIAITRWGDLLKGWLSTNSFIKKGKVYIGERAQRDYDSILSHISRIYGTSEYELNDIFTNDNPEPVEKFVHSDTPDPATGMYGKYKPLDKVVISFVKNLRKTAGIMTNLDVVKSNVARFFVHADDNELPMGGYDDKGFETEPYSYDRVCEIVFNYLVKIGRIKPDDEKFNEFMKIDESKLTKWNIKNNNLFRFSNWKNLTWADLVENTLTVNLHEG